MASTVKLGDEMNGFRAEGRCWTWADVEEWLNGMVRVYYPDSDYARKTSDKGRRFLAVASSWRHRRSSGVATRKAALQPSQRHVA
jgi:hypothetical protein